MGLVGALRGRHQPAVRGISRLGDVPVRHADHAGAGAGRGDPDAFPSPARAARAQPEVRESGDVPGPRATPSPDPLEQTPPTVELIDPRPPRHVKPRTTRHVSGSSTESTSTTSCWWSTKPSPTDLPWDEARPRPAVGGSRPDRGDGQRPGQGPDEPVCRPRSYFGHRFRRNGPVGDASTLQPRHLRDRRTRLHAQARPGRSASGPVTCQWPRRRHLRCRRGLRLGSGVAVSMTNRYRTSEARTRS